MYVIVIQYNNTVCVCFMHVCAGVLLPIFYFTHVITAYGGFFFVFVSFICVIVFVRFSNHHRGCAVGIVAVILNFYSE